MRFSIIISCLLVTLAIQIPVQGWAQQKEHLTPLNYQKIAFIDAARVRKEFVAYETAKEKMYNQNLEKRKDYEAASQALEKQTKDQLKKDSIHKLQQKQVITDKAAVKRAELRDEFFAAIKKKNAERTALTITYEDKIREAINIILREGAFTETRWSKDSTGSTYTDITEQVLQKLNQNQ